MLQDMLRKLHSIKERLLKLRERGFNVDGELELVAELEEELLCVIKDFNEEINFIYLEEWTPPGANTFKSLIEIKIQIYVSSQERR